MYMNKLGEIDTVWERNKKCIFNKQIAIEYSDEPQVGSLKNWIWISITKALL